MPAFNLEAAAAQLPELIEMAASGEEVVITKAGIPVAFLVAVQRTGKPRAPVNTMKITHIAEDFDAPSEEVNGPFCGKRRAPVGPMVDPPLPDDFNDTPEEFNKLFYGET